MFQYRRTHHLTIEQISCLNKALECIVTWRRALDNIDEFDLTFVPSETNKQRIVIDLTRTDGIIEFWSHVFIQHYQEPTEEHIIQ